MKSSIHHWLVFVGMKAAGNKFILGGRYLWFKHAQGDQWVYFHLPGSERGKGADNARTASFFIIYYLVGEQPVLYWDGALSCQSAGSRRNSWTCRARKPYTGVESAIRHLRCSGLLYPEVFQLCYSTSGIPWSADPEMRVCARVFWGCLLKYRFPAFPTL